MTDTRMEWISKRAYTIWEAAGRPDGEDRAHWEQAEREREELEKVALPGKTAAKPLIEISGKAKKKVAAAPAIAKTAAKKGTAAKAAKTV